MLGAAGVGDYQSGALRAEVFSAREAMRFGRAHFTSLGGTRS